MYIFSVLNNTRTSYKKHAMRGLSTDMREYQKQTSLRCNGSPNIIYLKDLKENKRFIDIGPTMAKWPGGVGSGQFFSKFSQNRF